MIPRNVSRLALAMCIAGALLAVFLGWQYGIASWPQVALLTLLAFAVENYAFQLPIAGSVSLSFALSYAAMLHSGPLAGLLCGLAVAYTIEEYRAKKPLILVLFNAGQLALSAGLGGLVYFETGGMMLAQSQELASTSTLVPALLGALTFYLINVVTVAYAASSLTGRPFSSVLREQGFLLYGASLLVLALLGLLIAYLLASGSWLGLLMLVLPFVAARRTFRVYAELTEAYTSTVRSLVTAIEAKDPYTRGHSERVAVYARGLAERLGAPRSEVDLLERAALLHDVGKIGIPLDTLTSPNQLSSEEVRLIRQHPSVGSQLVRDVEFLSDTVPVILHHHERIDGAGYPLGLISEGSPRLARMLAVADSYDAMTSDRAYRIGMSMEEAVAEMRRVAGAQLDASMTEHFIDMLADPTFEVPV